LNVIEVEYTGDFDTPVRPKIDNQVLLVGVAEVKMLIAEYSSILRLNNVSQYDGATYFALDVCPIVGRAHNGMFPSDRGKTALILGPDALGFKCFADKCSGKTLSDVITVIAKAITPGDPGSARKELWNRIKGAPTPEWIEKRIGEMQWCSDDPAIQSIGNFDADTLFTVASAEFDRDAPAPSLANYRVSIEQVRVAYSEVFQESPAGGESQKGNFLSFIPADEIEGMLRSLGREGLYHLHRKIQRNRLFPQPL
jgi:hypothetical protein